MLVRMSEPYRCIAIDYPWDFKDKLPGNKRGAAKHYNTMPVQSLDLGISIADDAHFFIWRVAAMQEEAFDLAHRLDAVVKSELVWIKQTKTGKRHFGMGHHVRMEHEVCLIATRGKGAGVQNHAIRSCFEAPVGRHSQKPDEFYRIVESMVPGPRADVFARCERPGWTCIGNEVPAAPKTLVARE